MAQLDTLVLGQRVREARRRAGLTLAELGEKVARPAPYLSLLENGKVEPKIGLIGDLADALRRAVRRPARSGATQPPGRARDRARATPAASRTTGAAAPADQAVGEGARRGPRTSRHAGEGAAATRTRSSTERRLRAADRARLANVSLRNEMRDRDNYFAEIEKAASRRARRGRAIRAAGR